MTQIAKIFQNGRSQAVRLPKEYRFEGKEVYIRRVGPDVILSAKPSSWKDFFFSDKNATSDFMKKRKGLDLEERNIFK